MLDDAEIEEELAPGVITLCRGHKHDGHVVTKVVNTPQQDPIILLISHVEILSIKNKRRGELRAITEGELIVVWKFFQFLFTDAPRTHGRHPVFSAERTKRESIEVIAEDCLGIQETGIDGKMLGTPLTEIADNLFSATKPNNSIRTGTEGAFIFLHMPHLDAI